MANLMTGTLSAIIKQGLDERAKTDAAFAAKYQTKKLDDCVADIYKAFESMARKAVKGSGGAALNGSDDLIISAATHWYDEDKPTTESIVAILEGGTEVHVQTPKKEQGARSKGQATPKPTPTATAEPVAKEQGAGSKGQEKPKPKPIPTMGVVKPAPKPVEEEEDEDGEMF